MTHRNILLPYLNGEQASKQSIVEFWYAAEQHVMQGSHTGLPAGCRIILILDKLNKYPIAFLTCVGYGWWTRLFVHSRLAMDAVPTLRVVVGRGVQHAGTRRIRLDLPSLLPTIH